MMTRFGDRAAGWTRGSRIVAVTLLVSLSTTGCFDRQELEQQAFVTTLGVDLAPDGAVDCTFQIAAPKAAGGGSSGGGSGGQTPPVSKGPVTVRGRTVLDALTMANTTIERSLTLAHLNSVVFGEDLAKQGLEATIRPLTRVREFRRTVYVRVAKGTARDIMTSEQPLLESTPTRVPDDIQSVGKRNGMMPLWSRMQNLTMSLETPHQSLVLPLYALNSAVKDDPKGEAGISGAITTEAGSLRRAGGNPVEFMGGAVFRKDRLVGYLTGTQMMDLRILRGTLSRSTMLFADPLSPRQSITVSLRRERAPRVQVSLQNPVAVHIFVPLDADLTGVESSVDYTNQILRARLEQSAGRELGQRLTAFVRGWANDGMDLIPISQAIRGKFYTDAQFARYPWESRLKRANIQVTVAVHIRRFGVELGPLQTQL